MRIDFALREIINKRDQTIERLQADLSDLETIAEAVEHYCWPQDGEEAYGWLMAQAVRRLREERDRLIDALRMTGGVEKLAQCPVCFSERTNGEHHEDDCDLIATTPPGGPDGRAG